MDMYLVKREDDESCANMPHVPKNKCEVVIHSPSQTRIPAGIAKSEPKEKINNLYSALSIDRKPFKRRPESTFSMNEYELLDWHHSGPKFDAIKVEYKVRRSSSKRRLLSPVTSKSHVKIEERSQISTPTLPEPSNHRTNDQPGTPAERKQADIPTLEKKAAKPPTKSPFFSSPASHRKSKAVKESKPHSRGGTVSCIPFPPLSASSFGLLQEKLAHDPFRLLIGVTFLNRTVGKHAIPVFFELMEKYPTPADILTADKEDIISITRHLGLQVIRAETFIKYAQLWIQDPPARGRRYRVENYPNPGDGKEIKRHEVIDDEDLRTGAWEIGHMTKGRYAIDSWRIFCRDVLRGEAQGWNGEGRDGGFQPEWMRVQPRDKELIACLRWMWLREGFEWDPITGEKEVASRELMEAAIAGRIAWDDKGGMRT